MATRRLATRMWSPAASVLRQQASPGMLPPARSQFVDTIHNQVSDPYRASYALDDPFSAATELTETLLIQELGKVTYSQAPKMKGEISGIIKMMLNESAEEWGMACSRFDIRDIFPQDRNDTAQLDLLMEHSNLLNLILEAVHKSAKSKVPDERMDEAKSSSTVLEKRLRLTNILLASLLLFFAALFAIVVTATVYYLWYPEEALRLQDRIVEGYINSARYVFSHGWFGETMEDRYKREAQEKDDLEEKKKCQEEEAMMRKQKQEVDELLRKKLQGMTMWRWILHRLGNGSRRGD